MSLLVNGMKMPKEGEYHMTLYVCSDGQAYIDVDSFPVDEDRFDVVSVPTPHGRLIDKDALIADWNFGTSCNDCKRDAYRCQWYEDFSAMDVCCMIEGAPTIIPADNDAAMRKESGE